jgi:hypothetical protein
MEVEYLLEIWNIDSSNPDYENYVIRAKEIIAEKYSPEMIAKKRKQSEKNNNKYRRPKIRR